MRQKERGSEMEGDREKKGATWSHWTTHWRSPNQREHRGHPRQGTVGYTIDMEAYHGMILERGVQRKCLVKI